LVIPASRWRESIRDPISVSDGNDGYLPQAAGMTIGCLYTL